MAPISFENPGEGAEDFLQLMHQLRAALFTDGLTLVTVSSVTSALLPFLGGLGGFQAQALMF